MEKYIVLVDADDAANARIVESGNKNMVFSSHDAADIWVQNNACIESSCFLIIEIS